jgi:outer membrane protein assembly factor BamB
VYHGDSAGSGVAPAVTAVDVSSPAWTSPSLDGELYGEPLVSGGMIFVATENDTVYALSASTGTIAWSSHLAAPVPAGALPCGDITPTVGVTGTPVLNASSGELFVVADELLDGHPAHQLVGLSAATGRIELDQNVDPTGSTPSAILQRTGLTLDAGHVVFGYGGNFGDCSTYHGWVMSVPETGGTPAAFAVDSGPGESQGAVWMGGAAPTVDASGNIWVTAGNGSVTSASHAYDDSDSVLELSPSLSLEQYFAPTSWASDNARDLDFSTGVALLNDGQVVAASKSRTAFLLNGSSLGGIGGQQAELTDACGTVIDGGLAVEGTTVYLPCRSGPVAVRASSSPAGLRLLWSSSVGGGPPIVAAGLVWTIGADGTLYGLDQLTGAVTEQATIGAPANHFPTPAVGAGLLLAPSANRVVAFRASSAAPAASTTTTTRPPTTTTTTARSTLAGGTDPWILVAAIGGGLVVLGILLTLAFRRRRGADSNG